MSNASTALTYGAAITLASGVIGYGLALFFRHTVFKGRRRTIGVGLSLAGIAALLLLGGAAVQETVFASRPSAAVTVMVLTFAGTIWYGLRAASNEATYRSARRSNSFGRPEGGTVSRTEVESSSRRISPAVVSTNIDVEPPRADEDELYATAWTEFETEDIDRGLWSRCFAESNGDENRAKAMYLTERVNALQGKERREKQIAKEIDVYNDWGETKLMEAAKKGDKQAVCILLQSGANPHLRERYTGDTAKQIAEKKGRLEVIEDLEDAERLWNQE